MMFFGTVLVWVWNGLYGLYIIGGIEMPGGPIDSPANMQIQNDILFYRGMANILNIVAAVSSTTILFLRAKPLSYVRFIAVFLVSWVYFILLASILTFHI